jgi:radical SAM protein with 4Fe4S-binding SPASM domain
VALDVYLTNACNLRCKYCFNLDDATAPQIPLLDVCKILEAAYLKGHRYVSITGGEPFIYKRIFDVLDFAHGLGFWIQILTHGGLLTEERIKSLKRYWRLRVRISLDGGDSFTHDQLRGDGTFDATVKKIDQLIQAGINVGVGMTVSDHNVDQIRSVVEMCTQKGIAFLRMTPVARVKKGRSAQVTSSLHERILEVVIEETIRNKDHIDVPRTSLKPLPPDINVLTTRRCLAGSGFFGITPDKKILPCPLIAQHPKIRSVHFESGESFDEVTRHMDTLFEGMKSNLKGICGTCEFREVCYGGCLAEKLSFDRELEDEQPVCTKKILEKLRSKFQSEDFDKVVRSWVEKLSGSLEASDTHACMRQAPYWSMNFRSPGRWNETNVRFS